MKIKAIYPFPLDIDAKRKGITSRYHGIFDGITKLKLGDTLQFAIPETEDWSTELNRIAVRVYDKLPRLPLPKGTRLRRVTEEGSRTVAYYLESV